MEAPVTRDSNPDGPIESENVETRNAEPSSKPDINREIKDTNLEEPDELYDSSSDISGSGDEFVPDSTSESEDSDSSLTMKKKRPSLMDLFDDSSSTGLCDTTLPDSGPPGAEEPCTDAMTESDGDTRYQTGKKRQSPADSLNVPACDSTVPHQMTFGDSGEKEQCSSQDTHQSIVVGASQKKDGIRVYNKRHYCLYCSRPYAKMARHLEKAHEDKADVAKALSFPKRSNERLGLVWQMW
ncbi:Cell wall alpha-13-glucan synthase mok12 [Dissostichus eleginoides]|uniref:Cell wall alpha-13-glucan synthase mok12 n=1 Tax=Dissostichus eleginoides TaxID=100907 RepID=A0AAD9F595_DISEL|nr:Cell wall alpha-13-glucan synthase mok12 [Dissostichus eleginoides]